MKNTTSSTPTPESERDNTMRKQRHNVYLSAHTWAYLNKDGQPSQMIEKLAEERMITKSTRTNPETIARERINGMGFTDAEQDFIWYDWWPNWDEHISWLLDATREEIKSWIEAAR